MDPGLAAYKFTFQLSPIILTGGVASAIPGGMLPIISITEAINFVTGLLSEGSSNDLTANLDNFFANFQPLPGSTLIAQQIGNYPFANQAVAGNAVIAQPTTISLQMICPARETVGYLTKLATMEALRATLEQHNASGGTYTIATPSRFYDNCVMLQMVDVSDGQTKQGQDKYRLDFWRPLLTLEQAQQAQNSLMSKISAGLPVGGDPPAWSGLSPTVGLPSTVAGPSVVPALSNPGGAGIAPPPSL